KGLLLPGATPLPQPTTSSSPVAAPTPAGFRFSFSSIVSDVALQY
ncbi:hypothetical protein Hamer_G020579, partial [Homarus americanus]